ncbi:hypothetical protein FJ444_02360 [Aestuariibacter sp. GS-14]|uniref:hypothetical protein n=1 Tax=Aestuariibacter sp. GS-14 TaxID=2590670 RepID=UPI001126BC08|nr:hypothetical protein [Aestuariibacter sp. GS-14]TPV62133.1 hypothetical protein FJ444_02360 [Aestuariibacter sp. GS-14]
MERIEQFRPALIATLCAAVFSTASVADVQITGSVNSSLVHQSLDSSDDTPGRYEDRDTLQISPTVVASYISNKLNANVAATHLYQRFELDAGSRSDSFTEFTYNGTLNVIDNVFQIFAQGSQGYQSVRPGSYTSSDFLLNNQDLTKTTTHSIGAALAVARNDFADVSISGRYYQAKSDASLTDDELANQNTGIDSKGASATLVLANGDWFRDAYWNASANYRKIDRQDFGFFESQSANGQIGYNLYGDFGLVVTATHEEFETEGQLSGGFGLFDGQFQRFNTYGVGLNYRPAAGRFFTVTANKISTDGNDDGETFIGVSTQWQFSPRTSISGDYGRRYYGESGSLTFNYGTRAARASVSYQESTTTYSSLLFDFADAGTFVCPAGAVDIIDCFQPDSLDYELQPGEQAVQFTEVISEVTEQVVLRRQLSSTLGFQKRKLRVSFDARYIDTTYSENNRQQIQKVIGMNTSLQAGARSSLYARAQYSIFDTELNGTEGESNNKVYTLGVRNQLSRGLSVNAELRYMDNEDNRDLTTPAFTLNETRITLGLTYRMQTNGR